MTIDHLPKFFSYSVCFVLAVSLLLSCSTHQSIDKAEISNPLIVANLSEGKSQHFDLINETFSTNNPGYTLDYLHDSKLLDQGQDNRVVFIQQGSGTAMVSKLSSKFSVGDIIMLKPGQKIETDSLFSALIVSVPHEIPEEIPQFIRPDWDENITDSPGGCATASNAYRRILLTWKNTVGPYVFHSVNAHRVRIMNSFSHYHPKVGGFDEFYLVQMAAPTAKLITSNKIKEIEGDNKLNARRSTNLMQTHALKVGDLVYLPRGLMHRGVGNVLAQVITVPGFVPGAEIGVDHHLLKINNRLNLSVTDALPYNKEASAKAIIK